MNLLHYNNLSEFSDEIVHFSSTRLGGISIGAYSSLNLGRNTADERKKIATNFQLLADELNIDVKNILNANQVHSSKVLVVDDEFVKSAIDNRNLILEEGWDAMITDKRGFMLTVTTADCVPVLLYDSVKKVVAAVHSGWRGTAKNIVAEVFDQMRRYGSCAENVAAAVGPCISKENYEVSKDVVDEFSDMNDVFTAKDNGKYLLDLKMAVNRQLRMLGIKNIEISEYCTFKESELFFSVRRQGQETGRQLSGIMLKP